MLTSLRLMPQEFLIATYYTNETWYPCGFRILVAVSIDSLTILIRICICTDQVSPTTTARLISHLLRLVRPFVELSEWIAGKRRSNGAKTMDYAHNGGSESQMDYLSLWFYFENWFIPHGIQQNGNYPMDASAMIHRRPAEQKFRNKSVSKNLRN